jgi:aminodeoxychorismate lyase
MSSENLISKNFEIFNATEAKIGALSSAVFYGCGVFTTIAIYNQKPFQWERHWKRLEQDSQRLNIQPPEEEKLKNALVELLEKNNIKQGRARITIFEESMESIWAESMRRTSTLITTSQFREIPEEMRLRISPYRVNSKSALKGIKSCNYLENLIAFEEAKSKKFDEAIRLNEKDQVTSACMANVFWIEDGTVFTPSLETGCLEGTTRSFVIELCKELGIEVYATESDIQEVLRAEEVFLTSSGIGIVPVVKIESEFFKNELTATLKREFYRRVSSI